MALVMSLLLLGLMEAEPSASALQEAIVMAATTGTCPIATSNAEVTVCGTRSRPSPYRLPETLRKSGETAAVGVKPRLPLSATDLAPCGIFAGERHCGKREAATYGYGAGRDPITAIIRLAHALTDPDR